MSVKFHPSFKQQDYIRTVKHEFCMAYPQFTPEQIEAPIKTIVEYLIYEASLCSSQHDLAISVLEKCQKFLKERSSIDETELSQSMRAILYALMKNEASIRYDMTDRSSVSFPEHDQEIYLTFVSAVTEKILRDVLENNHTLSNRSIKRSIFSASSDQPIILKRQRIG